jgi:hypothetical protein
MFKIFLYIFFITLSINIYSQQLKTEDFLFHKQRNNPIKEITEKTRNKWKTISYFDNNGFLIKYVVYHNYKFKGEYIYEYLVSDTLIMVKSYEILKNRNNDKEYYNIDNFYYNSLYQLYKHEIYFSSLEIPSVWYDNFIYENNKIQSYEFHRNNENEFDKTIYTYFDNKVTKHRYYIKKDTATVSVPTIYIYKNGRLTDKIIEGAVVDAFSVHWNKDFNMVYTKYSYFDKYGNWTKSYFLREKKCKKFCSKRKIKYWK